MFKSFFKATKPTADQERQAASTIHVLRLRMERIVALNARRKALGEPLSDMALGAGTVSRATLLAKAEMLQTTRSAA